MLVNFDEVVRGHNHFLAENERLIAEESDRAAKHAVEHVQRYPEFKPRTGNLQKKTKAKAFRTKSGALIKLTNTAKYAEVIDGGSKAHIIRPKRSFSEGVTVQKRNFLRFRGRGGGWVFARMVKHPGTRPYKFGFRAINSAYRLLGQGLERRMQQAASKF